jgi:hypothetical protein
MFSSVGTVHTADSRGNTGLYDCTVVLAVQKTTISYKVEVIHSYLNFDGSFNIIVESFIGNIDEMSTLATMLLLVPESIYYCSFAYRAF